MTHFYCNCVASTNTMCTKFLYFLNPFKFKGNILRTGKGGKLDFDHETEEIEFFP